MAKPYRDVVYELWRVGTDAPNTELQPQNHAAALESIKRYLGCSDITTIIVQRVKVRETRTVVVREEHSDGDPHG